LIIIWLYFAKQQHWFLTMNKTNFSQLEINNITWSDQRIWILFCKVGRNLSEIDILQLGPVTKCWVLNYSQVKNKIKLWRPDFSGIESCSTFEAHGRVLTTMLVPWWIEISKAPLLILNCKNPKTFRFRLPESRVYIFIYIYI